MGFFDKIKGAMNAVTGGGAKVTIEFPQQTFFPGETVPVRIIATSTGQEIKSKGIFVDLREIEQISIAKKHEMVPDDINVERPLTEQEIQLAPAFVLPAGQTMQFEGKVTIPGTAEPTYAGRYTKHLWSLRGRVEALGNDPDSGHQPIRVGVR